MLAVARKREADEIALTRGIVVTQPVVGKVAQLIIVEIENGDRLARTRLLSAVSLIEQRCVTAVRAKCNGRWKTVGAGEVAGDRKRQSLAGRKIDPARAIGGASDDEHDQERGESGEGHSGDLFHVQRPRRVFTIRA